MQKAVTPKVKHLSLSKRQVTKITELRSMATRINQELAIYINSILDANDLQGTWDTGELKDQTLTVKKA